MHYSQAEQELINALDLQYRNYKIQGAIVDYGYSHKKFGKSVRFEYRSRSDVKAYNLVVVHWNEAARIAINSEKGN